MKPKGLQTRQRTSMLTGQPVGASLRERARQLRRDMTLAERLLWESLRAHRFASIHFRRQQVLGGFIADFYCATARLVIEVDGPVHDSQLERDRDRDAIFTAHRVRVMRFTNQEILEDLSGILDQIGVAIDLPFASDS